jgi:hypothetical protein
MMHQSEKNLEVRKMNAGDGKKILRWDLQKYGRMHEEWLRTGTSGRPL